MSKVSRQIIIRKTISDDAEHVVKLGAMVYKSAYRSIMPKEVLEYNDKRRVDRLENFYKRLDNKNEINLVATDGCKIVAYAIGCVLSYYDHYRELGYSDLMAIYVDDDYQHCGIGKKLFDSVIEELRKRGSTKMEIGVLKENMQARNAYEKWGGVLDSVYTSCYEKIGYKFPEIFYLFEL